MARIRLTTEIDAPPDRVFGLARSVDHHTESMAATGETVVDGVTNGLLSDGDRVTWRARHFGVPFELTVEITAFDRPTRFRDTMINGPFDEQLHDHYFEPANTGTRMRVKSSHHPQKRLEPTALSTGDDCCDLCQEVVAAGDYNPVYGDQSGVVQRTNGGSGHWMYNVVRAEQGWMNDGNWLLCVGYPQILNY